MGLECKLGGKFHLKLNIGSRPIANKYCEGKVKRTLKRELKVPEMVCKEAMCASGASASSCSLWSSLCAFGSSAWARSVGNLVTTDLVEA